jgi:hypothetical protein
MSFSSHLQSPDIFRSYEKFGKQHLKQSFMEITPKHEQLLMFPSMHASTFVKGSSTVDLRLCHSPLQYHM